MPLSPDQPRRGSRGAENTLCSCCCWLRTREQPPNKGALCIKQDFPEINGYSSVRTDSKGKPTRCRSSTGGDGVQGVGPGTGTQPLLLLVRSFCILTPNPLQLRGGKTKDHQKQQRRFLFRFCGRAHTGKKVKEKTELESIQLHAKRLCLILI